jgi:D-alanine-D-alanine ligase-like ATP-grasp enzyme
MGSEVDTQYLRKLKTALTGNPEQKLVLVCNFEAEQQWAEGFVGLPSAAMNTSAVLIRRMEELGALLAGPDDVLILKRPLDSGYRAYLADVGLAPPTVLVPENTTPDRPTAQDVLASPETLRRLTELAEEGACLLPMGTTEWEQALAEKTGLRLAVPDASTFQRVNSKIYGRRVAEKAGLTCVPGACCETVEEFVSVLDEYRPRLADGDFRLVVKDAYGVSGKGLVVLDGLTKADRLKRMVLRSAQRRDEPRLHVVVEEFLPKRCDLNYQVTVSRDGHVSLDFVKQALTEHGVHKGHLMPPELDAAQHTQIAEAAQAVGRHLHADGYHGVAGIDAIVDSAENVYPVLEINARLNMSTYQGGVTERVQQPGQVAMARHYALRLTGPRTFDEMRTTLGPVLDRRAGDQVVVTCFGTVNANAHQSPPFEGRLYTLLVAPDRQRLAALDDVTTDALR